MEDAIAADVAEAAGVDTKRPKSFRALPDLRNCLAMGLFSFHSIDGVRLSMYTGCRGVRP